MLEARSITFGYTEGSPIIKGFSATFNPQDRVCISAPSGVGKTTLCRLLAGYETAQCGMVLLDGKPLLSKGVCPVQLVGQHPELSFDPRLRMKASLAESGTLDEGLMDSLGIKQEWLSRYPHELSGGELMRFAICRALMTRPKFLIADEISAMMDAITQAEIWHFLMDHASEQSMGIIFVSHSPVLAKRIATSTIELGL